MQKAGSELRRLSVPLSTGDGTENALGVYFSTRVLRCVWGFQMELPNGHRLPALIRPTPH